MNKPFNTYPGGKNNTGVYQAIINQIPPHEVMISGFAGNCGVMANMAPATHRIAVDADKVVTEGWNAIENVVPVCSDFMKWWPYYYSKMKLEGKHFVFIDPPYLKGSRSSGSKIYNNEMMDTESHKELLKMLRNSRYKDVYIMIVHYPNSLYNSWLSDWRQVDFTGRTRQGTRQERLYMNYELPEVLHDPSYVGNDYREREALAKRAKSFVSKFEAMPVQHRQHIFNKLKKFL